MKKAKLYSLYKDDEEIAFGTMQEIADKCGVKLTTIYFYNTSTYKKRVKKVKEEEN